MVPRSLVGIVGLWDEVRAAHTWWVEQGHPDESDWLFTVHPDQQTIDLTAHQPLRRTRPEV